VDGRPTTTSSAATDEHLAPVSIGRPFGHVSCPNRSSDDSFVLLRCLCAERFVMEKSGESLCSFADTHKWSTLVDKRDARLLLIRRQTNDTVFVFARRTLVADETRRDVSVAFFACFRSVLAETIDEQRALPFTCFVACRDDVRRNTEPTEAGESIFICSKNVRRLM
jgi:hypothetical protein